MTAIEPCRTNLIFIDVFIYYSVSIRKIFEMATEHQISASFTPKSSIMSWMSPLSPTTSPTGIGVSYHPGHSPLNLLQSADVLPKRVVLRGNTIPRPCSPDLALLAMDQDCLSLCDSITILIIIL